MAKIKQCKDCKAEIPANAKKCMHCGTKQPKSVGVLGLILAIFFGFVVYSCSLAMNQSGSTKAAMTPQQQQAANAKSKLNREESAASSLCMDAVRARVKFPSSVDFSAFSSPANERMAGGGWVIYWAFESKNGFGNLISQMAQCGVDKGKLINFSIGNR